MLKQFIRHDRSGSAACDPALRDYVLSMTPAQRIELLDKRRLFILRRQKRMFSRYGFDPASLVPLDDDDVRRELLWQPIPAHGEQ